MMDPESHSLHCGIFTRRQPSPSDAFGALRQTQNKACGQSNDSIYRRHRTYLLLQRNSLHPSAEVANVSPGMLHFVKHQA